MKTHKIASRLRQVSHKIASPQWSDSKAWELVDEIGWGTKTTDYKKIKEKLMSEYGMEEMDGFNEWLESKCNRLAKAIREYVEEYSDSGNWEEPDLPYGGDDSFSDMVHHVVGLGKNYYEKVIKEIKENPKSPTSTLSKLKVVESFSYAIPSSYDYKRKMPSGDRIRLEIGNLEDAIKNIKNSPYSEGLEGEIAQAEKIVASLKDPKVRSESDADEMGWKFKEIGEKMVSKFKHTEKEFESFKTRIKSFGYSFSDRVHEIVALKNNR